MAESKYLVEGTNYAFYVALAVDVASTSGDEGGSSTCNWSITATAVRMATSQNYRTFGVKYSATIGGESITGTAYYNGNNSSSTLANGTLVVPHNYVVKKTLSFSGAFTATYARFNDSIDFALDGSLTLEIAKMASQIMVTSAYIGVAPTITINRVNSRFTDTLTYTFGSHGGTIAEKTSATTIKDFVYPLTFYAEIPNALYGIGVIICETYDGSELVGTSYREFYAHVNKSASTPTIFPTIKDTNAATVALTGDSNTLVRYMSIASVTIGAEARNYATIKSQICTNGSQAITTATGTIDGVEQAKFSCSATDSRGYTTAISMTKPFVEYAKPTCNLVESSPDASGNVALVCSGTYWAGNFGVANNTITAQYRYKEKSGGTYSEWAEMSVTTDGNGYTGTAALSGLDYRKTYTFQARAVDALAAANSGEADATSLPVFHWSDSDFVFEVPVIFKKGIEGVGGEDVNLSNYYTKSEVDDLIADIDTGGGEDVDLSNYYTKSEVDDLIADIDTGGGVEVVSGTWNPTLSPTAAISSYTTRKGWYMLVGNVITIGFHVKATCKTAYHSTAIQITGLPLAPAVTSFGGGVLHNAYLATGFCFEGWAVETTGVITPRIQPCNPTKAGNLEISSTAGYTSGGGVITLGGTITFQIT